MCCEHAFGREFASFPDPEESAPESGVRETRREKPKRAERPSEKGQAVEEADRIAAQKIRGENLTETEFQERAISIAKLRRVIDAWAKEHVPEGAGFDRRALQGLVDYLSEEHAETVAEITKDFLDRRMYPNRPVIKLHLRDIGKMPDVLIFGWRGKDKESGETKIHDHADSSVALRIHQGEVEETVYPIEREEWMDRKPGQAMNYFGSKSKRYRSGLSKTYASPYLHTVGGTPENDLSVSIHAYWRPTTQVAYDFAIEGDKFIEIGVS